MSLGVCELMSWGIYYTGQNYCWFRSQRVTYFFSYSERRVGLNEQRGGAQALRAGALFVLDFLSGDLDVFRHCELIFRDGSIGNGYLYTAPAGSGHFMKMVHDGIEYGMMQAIAEGFDVMQHSQYDFDYEQVAQVWNHGSVAELAHGAGAERLPQKLQP